MSFHLRDKVRRWKHHIDLNCAIFDVVEDILIKEIVNSFGFKLIFDFGWAKYTNFGLFTKASGHEGWSPHHLITVFRVNSQVKTDIDGFIKATEGMSSDQFECLPRSILDILIISGEEFLSVGLSTLKSPWNCLLHFKCELIVWLQY